MKYHLLLQGFVLWDRMEMAGKVILLFCVQALRFIIKLLLHLLLNYFVKNNKKTKLLFCRIAILTPRSDLVFSKTKWIHAIYVFDTYLERLPTHCLSSHGIMWYIHICATISATSLGYFELWSQCEEVEGLLIK